MVCKRSRLCTDGQSAQVTPLNSLLFEIDGSGLLNDKHWKIYRCVCTFTSHDFQHPHANVHINNCSLSAVYAGARKRMNKVYFSNGTLLCIISA